MSREFELAVGQKLREVLHIARFRAAVAEPRKAQEARLLSMIRRNEKSLYGRRYGFERIRSIADFQAQIPPNSYEDLSPYIDATMNGASNQLTCEQPLMYATTSGTTGKPKFIPITRQHLRDYTHAFQIHNYQMISDHPNAASGRFLIIASNDEEGRSASGIPYGAVSGLLNRKQPAILKKYFSLPYELCKIKDVSTKYYLMLRIAAAQNVTAVLCCNPSSLLLLADQLKEHACEILADIYDGRLNKRHAPAESLREAFAPFLSPNRCQARRLSEILEREGQLKPTDLWPNLGLISCWKGGPMSFYLEQLPEMYGQIPIRDFGYMASEGRGSIPLSDNGAAGVLALTGHFFEFVEESEIDSPQQKFLTADQLEAGGRYYIYFTTAAGLYRYNINDLIEVVGHYERAPLIQFVRKGAGISSITGEKLTEEQVRVALTQAIRQLALSQISHFTAAVQLGKPPYYACFIELSRELPESLRDEFLRVFDRSLIAQNPEYEDKRKSKRLGAPVLEILPTGSYTQIRQRRVEQGAPEAQVKIPLLAQVGDFQINQVVKVL